MAKEKSGDRKNAKNNCDIFSLKGILKFLAVGGLITAAIVAPGAVAAFKFLLKDENHVSWKKFNQSRARQYIYQLKKRGLVEEFKRKNKKIIALTAKGQEQIKKYDLQEISLKKGAWDGKWRIVIFDIPEKYKQARDALNKKFKTIGMRQLQKSVFVYPFPCREEIDFIADFFGVYRHILYLESKIADIEEDLKRTFNLA